MGNNIIFKDGKDSFNVPKSFSYYKDSLFILTIQRKDTNPMEIFVIVVTL
jgi:hypothetical protein